MYGVKWVNINFGAVRYFQVQDLLQNDYYPATRFTILIILLMNLSMLIVVSL